MHDVLMPDSRTVISPCGCLDDSTVGEFQSILEAEITSEQRFEILIDLSQIEFINVVGLAAIYSILLTAKKFDRKLIFCQITPPIRLLFELTQLDRVLEISDCRVD